MDMMIRNDVNRLRPRPPIKIRSDAMVFAGVGFSGDSGLTLGPPKVLLNA